jgi:hypothetical protein
MSFHFKKASIMKSFLFLLFFSFSSVCLAGDAEEILSILQANFVACNEEDADALMRTCSVDMPNRREFREESVKLWREKDIHYSIVDFKLLKVEDGFATAEIVQDTYCEDRNHADDKDRSYRNGTTLLPDAERVRYMAAFKKDFGKWKCYLTISDPVPVRQTRSVADR